MDTIASLELHLKEARAAESEAKQRFTELQEQLEKSTASEDADKIKKLEKELEVVLEEIRRGEDSPSRVLSQKMFATAYDINSYKRPVIGTDESVKSFTREKILKFYMPVGL